VAVHRRVVPADERDRDDERQDERDRHREDADLGTLAWEALADREDEETRDGRDRGDHPGVVDHRGSRLIGCVRAVTISGG
jgi:hypothetical protein